MSKFEQKVKSEFIVVTDRIQLRAASNGPPHPNVIIQTSIENLEKLVKKAKRNKKRFFSADKKAGRDCVFFIHLSPDVSFLFRYPTKKGKKRGKSS